jgi:hypothetical protein
MIIKDLIDYVEEHGRGLMFDGWPMEYIIGYIDRHAQDGHLIVVVDGNSKMIGFLAYKPYSFEKVVVVEGVFSTNMPEYMRALLRIYEERFSGWTVESEKRGKRYRRTPEMMQRMIKKMKEPEYV